MGEVTQQLEEVAAGVAQERGTHCDDERFSGQARKRLQSCVRSTEDTRVLPPRMIAIWADDHSSKPTNTAASSTDFRRETTAFAGKVSSG